EVLAERDRGRLQDAAAAPARRVVFPRLHASQDPLDWPTVRATHAPELADVPVDLHDTRRVRPGRVVQPIDVLGYQEVDPRTAFEFRQRQVPGVGRGAAHRAPETILPGADPGVGVGHVVLKRGRL